MAMGRTYRLYIVDDHPLILSGIEALLAGQKDIEVSGTAQSAEAAMDGLRIYEPDLVVIDGTLPGMSGVSLIKFIREVFPSMLTLALTLHEESGYIRELLKAGANGFVLKRSAADDLLHAVRAVLQGGTYIDPAVASKVFSVSPFGDAGTEVLSEREVSVVRCVAEGLSNKEISRQLSISVKTVETYRARACEKLDLRSRSALVRYALKQGWLAQAVS